MRISKLQNTYEDTCHAARPCRGFSYACESHGIRWLTYYGFQTVCKCPFRALLVTSATDSNQTWANLV